MLRLRLAIMMRSAFSPTATLTTSRAMFPKLITTFQESPLTSRPKLAKTRFSILEMVFLQRSLILNLGPRSP